MSQESLEQFMEKVGSNEELRSTIENQLDGDGNIGVDALITMGAENGCDFTVEDLTQNVELSDEDLDGVAGGVGSADSYSVALDQLLLAADQGTMSISSATKASTDVSIAQAVTDFTQGIAKNAADHVKKQGGKLGQG